MEHSDQLAGTIKRICEELSALAETLAPETHEPVNFPQWAAERIAEKKCLNCNKKWVRRGLCDAHWQVINRQLKLNPALEKGLIELGKMAPLKPKKPKGQALSLAELVEVLGGPIGESQQDAERRASSGKSLETKAPKKQPKA